MSHTVKIETKFKASEISQLLAAGQKFNWQPMFNTTINTYEPEQRQKVYTHALKNPKKDGFDIGLVLDETKDEVTCLCDPYDRSIYEQLGNGLCLLKQEYAIKIIENEYPAGTITRSETDNDGALMVEVTQY